LKELLAQFRAEVAPQSLANFRVHRCHFLTCECATPVAICQSVCERPSSAAYARAAFACEQVEELGALEQRLLWILDYSLDFFVRNFFRDNHRDVARDGGKSLELTKFFRRLSRKKIGV